MAHHRGSRFILDWRPHCRALDRNERFRIYFAARNLDVQSKAKGRRNGCLGHVGLAVLHALLFSFLNRKTGYCSPSYDRLMKATGLSRKSIAAGLQRLVACGFVRITHRICKVGLSGAVEQATNLYKMQASFLGKLNPITPTPRTRLLPLDTWQRPSGLSRGSPVLAPVPINFRWNCDTPVLVDATRAG